MLNILLNIKLNIYIKRLATLVFSLYPFSFFENLLNRFIQVNYVRLRSRIKELRSRANALASISNQTKLTGLNTVDTVNTKALTP